MNELVERINWCVKAIKRLNIGDVVIDIDAKGSARYNIMKSNSIYRQFTSIESFESYIENYLACRPKLIYADNSFRRRMYGNREMKFARNAGYTSATLRSAI